MHASGTGDAPEASGASAAASMLLDMAAYCSTDGLGGFTEFLRKRYPVNEQQVSDAMRGIISQLSTILFSAEPVAYDTRARQIGNIP